MALEDILWGGGSVIATSPEVASPVPPCEEERTSFIAQARRSLSLIGAPGPITSDDRAAGRVPIEGVTQEEIIDFLEDARRKSKEDYQRKLGQVTAQAIQLRFDLE